MHYCRQQKIKGIDCLSIFECYVFLRLLLVRAGNIELNPGPESDIETVRTSFTSDMKRQMLLRITSRLLIVTSKAHCIK